MRLTLNSHTGPPTYSTTSTVMVFLFFEDFLRFFGSVLLQLSQDLIWLLLTVELRNKDHCSQ
jgi:hypothetical protein